MPWWGVGAVFLRNNFNKTSLTGAVVMLRNRMNAPSVLISLLVAVSPARAESHLDDRFSLSLGLFVTDRGTEARLDGTAGIGTPIDLETDLGLDASDNVFRVDGYFRFNERHRLDFSVFDLSRTSSKQIGRDVQWGDELYAINTGVNTDFDLTIYKLAYTYSFIRRDRGYLGASFGVYSNDTKISLTEQNTGRTEAGDITAPLPVLGLRGQYDLTERWTFRASGEFFYLEFEDADGSLVDLYAGIEYAVRDFLDIGIGINSVELDVDVSGSRFQGSLDWRYTGGLVFFKLNFGAQ